MKDTKTHQVLTELGFSEYEAKAYCSVLANSPANGYQIAEQSGVPRAKIYETLEKLEARKAVARVDTQDSKAKVYAAIKPDHFLDDMLRTTARQCASAKSSLKAIQQQHVQVEILWRITSEQRLIEKSKELIAQAQKYIHAGLWDHEFDELIDDLLEAVHRGVKTACILYTPHPRLSELEQAGAGAIQHSHTKMQAIPEMGRQFMLTADRQHCITGTVFEDGNVDGVYSTNPGLVINTLDLVNHEIYLERIIQDTHGQLYDLYGAYLQNLDPYQSRTSKEKET